MDEKYSDLVSDVSRAIASSILSQEKNLVERAVGIDGDIAILVREIGRQATEEVLGATAEVVADEAASLGLKVEHRHSSPFLPSSE